MMLLDIVLYSLLGLLVLLAVVYVVLYFGIILGIIPDPPYPGEDDQNV